MNKTLDRLTVADLSSANPSAAFGCYAPVCFQTHSAMWKDGVITNLGVLFTPRDLGNDRRRYEPAALQR